MSWVNLAEGVNIDFLEKCTTKQVLGFMSLKPGEEDKRTYYKIMRIDKPRKKWWAREIILYKPDEVDIVEREQPDVS